MAGTLSVQKIQGLASSATPTTVEIASGHKISGAAGSIVAPGQVLQCVQYYAANPGSQTTTSAGFTASGLKKTITPKASGNLIIVQANISMSYAASSGHLKMYMNGSVMSGAGNYQVGYINISHNAYAAVSMQAQHTTTDTSALEFEIYVRSPNGATFTFVHDSASTAITLWEIAQ